MTVRFNKPARDIQTLRALAASSSTSFAKEAQAELQKRVHDALRKARAH